MCLCVISLFFFFFFSATFAIYAKSAEVCSAPKSFAAVVVRCDVNVKPQCVCVFIGDRNGLMLVCVCVFPQNVCRSCSEEKAIFQLDRSGRPIRDRFCKKCLVLVAMQRGSTINWNGVEAEQPPAYFDYVFQLSNLRSRFGSDLNSSVTTILSESNVIDTSYIDESMKRLGISRSELDASEWGDYYRRKRSHADRLSRSSYSSEEDLLSDLYMD